MSATPVSAERLEEMRSAIMDEDEAVREGAVDDVRRLLEANARWQSNSVDTWAAMTAMRNSINEHIPMPSIEGDLLRGPESSVFCSTVADAVINFALRASTPVEGAVVDGLFLTEQGMVVATEGQSWDRIREVFNALPKPPIGQKLIRISLTAALDQSPTKGAE